MNTYKAFLSAPFRSIKHSTYFSVYDRIFEKYIDNNPVLVEVGVLDGGSLFMWRELFGQGARIIGIDLNPKARQWEKEGFEIFIGTQSDPSFWKRFFETVGPIDVLLDDGGHTFEQQIVTVECALEHIKDDGLLVVEDTHSSYMKEFSGPSRLSFVSYAKNIVDGINYRFGTLAARKMPEKRVYSIEFFESFVVFHVNRQLSYQISEPIDNGGVSMQADDFRYAGSGFISMVRRLAARVNWVKDYRVIGSLVSKFWGSMSLALKRVNNWKRNSKLKKYFRY